MSLGHYYIDTIRSGHGCIQTFHGHGIPILEKREKIITMKTLGKGVSDLEVRLDYCKDPARSREKSNICFPV